MSRGGAAAAARLPAGFAPGAVVADAMLRHPKLHPAGLSVAAARDVFASTKTHMILLVTDEILVGALTRADLEGAPPPQAPALPLASLAGRTVPAGALLAPAYRDMCQRGLRRLAVTDPAGRLLGLLCLKRSFRGFCDDDGVAAMRAERAQRR